MQLEQEKLRFTEALAESQRMLERLVATLELAKKNCHGDVFAQADVMAKRAYELKVHAEWLHLVATGALAPDAGAQPGEPRQWPDRRAALDRRIAGMRRQILDARRDGSRR